MIKLIGICGGSASGKTAISQKLKKNNPETITIISQDSYYKPYNEYSMKERKNINFDHPDSFDMELLEEQLLQLKSGNIIQMPIYSFEKYTREDKTLSVCPNSIIVLEGMLILHYPKIRKLLDKSIYINTTKENMLKRMITRDVKERGRTVKGVIEQYRRDVEPMHDKFVEPLKKSADIIVNGNFEQDVVYKNITEYLEELHILGDGLQDSQNIN